MTIAKTILEQIGNKALYMIGAKNLVAKENGVYFKIMRNSKSVNLIEITLNGLDLYDVEFKYVSVKGIKVRSEVKGIYSDMLHAAIRENTGLETRMPEVIFQ